MVAEAAGERRAGASRAHGDREPAAAGDGGEDEGAVGRLVGGVDPETCGHGVGSNRRVDAAVAGRCDDEAHTVEVAALGTRARGSPPPRPGRGTPETSDADQPDHGAGGGEAVDLAGGDRTGADDEHGHIGQVEADG